jgi:hypothetical protein
LLTRRDTLDRTPLELGGVGEDSLAQLSLRAVQPALDRGGACHRPEQLAIEARREVCASFLVRCLALLRRVLDALGQPACLSSQIARRAPALPSGGLDLSGALLFDRASYGDSLSMKIASTGSLRTAAMRTIVEYLGCATPASARATVERPQPLARASPAWV